MITRPLPVRLLLRTVLLLATLACGRTSVAQDEAEPRRPNVLIAFADDWGRYASAYAAVQGPQSLNTVITTPNIDRVASEGTLFTNAHVTAPSCTPCRSSFLSGQYFWRTGRGAILQGAQWDPRIPAFPLMLRDAGYHIGQTYKVWSPGTPVDAPFGEKRYAYEQAGSRFNQFSQNVTRMVAQGQSVEQAKQVLYDEVLANFEDFLEDRKPDQPFCYWFGPTNVHRKWIKGSGKALWNIEPDRLKGKMPQFLPDVPEVREDLADYFGEVQAFDAAFGRLLARLEETGELDNTLVIVSGDHGAPGFPNGKCNLYDFGTGVTLAVRWGGDRQGRVVEDFVNITDLAPTILEAGGITPPEVMTGRSLVDILQSDREGQVDPLRDSVITGRERHVGTARDGYLPYPQRAIRTHDYLYIINFAADRWPMGTPKQITDQHTPSTEALENDTGIGFADMDASPTKAWLVEHRHERRWFRYYDIAFGKRPHEELYVLADDPDQVRNVAGDPEYADIREELNRRLVLELERTGDPRVTGDGLQFEKPPFAGIEESTAATQLSPQKPNVLFLFADDMCYQHVGALGHTDIETPHLDRLVRRGTTFTRAYNMGGWSGAICVASRTMLITGRDLWNAHHIYDHTREEAAAGRLWPQLMRDAGYKTYFTGKWHIKAEAADAFDVARNVRGGMPKDTPEQYNRPLEGQPDPWDPADPKFGGFWDGGRHWSEVVADDATEYLADASTHEQPFFMYIAFNAPHDPRQAPREYLEKYPLDRIELPVNFQPLYPHRLEIGLDPGQRDEKLAPYPRTEHAVKVHRQEYYALITHLDAQIGRVLDALERSGRAENTLIVFTADHGLSVGQHGLLGKQNMYDHSVRVPFLVVGPGIARDERIPAAIYLQDVVPTTLTLAGAEIPRHVDFQNLLPLLKGETRRSPYSAIYTAYMEVQRAVTHDGYKLIAYPEAGVLRLYHVASDPHEQHDLADDAAHAARKRALFDRLLTLQAQRDDPLDLRDASFEL